MKITKDTAERLSLLMQVHAHRHDPYSVLTAEDGLWGQIDSTRAEAANALGAYSKAQNTERRLLVKAGIAEGLAVIGLVGMLVSPLSVLIVLGAAGVASYSIRKAGKMSFEWPQ